MCHAELEPGQAISGGIAEHVRIELPSGEQMSALLAMPSDRSAPAVMVIADMFGPSPFYEGIVARLAASGLQALLPDYFFRLAPLPERTHEAAVARRAALDETASVEDLRAAVDWLRTRPGYSGRVGVLGFCMGGTFALDLSAYESDLVTVAYYGFPRPQATLVSPPPAPLDLVERMEGPILAFWGDADRAVGVENVERFAARMAAADKDFTHRIYPGLGHGFLAGADLDGGSAEPAGDSWQLALDHLGNHLRVHDSA